MINHSSNKHFYGAHGQWLPSNLRLTMHDAGFSVGNQMGFHWLVVGARLINIVQ